MRVTLANKFSLGFSFAHELPFNKLCRKVNSRYAMVLQYVLWYNSRWAYRVKIVEWLNKKKENCFRRPYKAGEFIFIFTASGGFIGFNQHRQWSQPLNSPSRKTSAAHKLDGDENLLFLLVDDDEKHFHTSWWSLAPASVGLWSHFGMAESFMEHWMGPAINEAHTHNVMCQISRTNPHEQ